MTTEKLDDAIIYTIVREALSECNSNGHLGLYERMAQSDLIAERATEAILRAHNAHSCGGESGTPPHLTQDVVGMSPMSPQD